MYCFLKLVTGTICKSCFQILPFSYFKYRPYLLLVCERLKLCASKSSPSISEHSYLLFPRNATRQLYVHLGKSPHSDLQSDIQSSLVYLIGNQVFFWFHRCHYSWFHTAGMSCTCDSESRAISVELGLSTFGSCTLILSGSLSISDPAISSVKHSAACQLVSPIECKLTKCVSVICSNFSSHFRIF